MKVPVVYHYDMASFSLKVPLFYVEAQLVHAQSQPQVGTDVQVLVLVLSGSCVPHCIGI
jgi:hypothetical protein